MFTILTSVNGAICPQKTGINKVLCGFTNALLTAKKPDEVCLMIITHQASRLKLKLELNPESVLMYMVIFQMWDPKLKYGKKKNRHKSIQKFILIKMD